MSRLTTPCTRTRVFKWMTTLAMSKVLASTARLCFSMTPLIRRSMHPTHTLQTLWSVLIVIPLYPSLRMSLSSMSQSMPHLAFRTQVSLGSRHTCQWTIPPSMISLNLLSPQHQNPLRLMTATLLCIMTCHSLLCYFPLLSWNLQPKLRQWASPPALCSAALLSLPQRQKSHRSLTPLNQYSKTLHHNLPSATPPLLPRQQKSSRSLGCLKQHIKSLL